jgi:AraC-like DNA-binding protein
MSRIEADRVHRAEDKSLVDILLRHITDLLDRPRSEAILTEKVRALIGINLGHRPITIATFARELQMSPRTLQRKLAEEGASMRLLVREYRQTLVALHLRGDKAGTMAQIARIAGYADSTVLWRARRSWGQSSPPSVRD